MLATRWATRGRQRHVNGFLDEHASLVLGSEDSLALLERFSQRLARLPEVLTGETTAGGLKGADRAIRGHERCLIAKDRSSDGLQGVKRIRGFDIGEADIIVATHRAGATATVTALFQGDMARFVNYTGRPEPGGGE